MEAIVDVVLELIDGGGNEDLLFGKATDIVTVDASTTIRRLKGQCDGVCGVRYLV